MGQQMFLGDFQIIEHTAVGLQIIITDDAVRQRNVILADGGLIAIGDDNLILP